MEPKGTLMQSQVPAYCPYPEPTRYTTPTYHFMKIHLNSILPSMPGSPKWSPSFRFHHQNPVQASPLPHTHYMPYLIHWFTMFFIYGTELTMLV